MSGNYKAIIELMSENYKALIEMIGQITELQPKDVGEWHEAMREVLKDGPAINFNAIPDDSDLVMNSIRYPPHTGRNLPPAHNPNSRCTTPPMESKMEDIKTVTHEGQVYQIDKPYLFLNANKRWEFGYLTKVNSVSQFPFINHVSEDFSSIKCLPEFRSGFGTITPAPIELDHGKAYTFDYRANRDSSIGVYSKNGSYFVTIGSNYPSDDCTNIRPMAVVEGVKS